MTDIEKLYVEKKVVMLFINASNPFIRVYIYNFKSCLIVDFNYHKSFPLHLQHCGIGSSHISDVVYFTDRQIKHYHMRFTWHMQYKSYPCKNFF